MPGMLFEYSKLSKAVTVPGPGDILVTIYLGFETNSFSQQTASLVKTVKMGPSFFAVTFILLADQFGVSSSVS